MPDAELARQPVRGAQIGAVADQQQAGRNLLADLVEDPHHRLGALHWAEIRDVHDDLRALVALREPLAQIRAFAAVMNATIEKVRDDLNVLLATPSWS